MEKGMVKDKLLEVRTTAYTFVTLHNIYYITYFSLLSTGL